MLSSMRKDAESSLQPNSPFTSMQCPNYRTKLSQVSVGSESDRHYLNKGVYKKGIIQFQSK